jgi:tight adherence protein B
MMPAAVLLGALGAAGILLVVIGAQPAPPRPRRRRWVALSVEPHQVVAALLAGAVVLVVTRQPVAAVLGALAGRAVASWRKPRVDDAALAEAIALWTEGLRNAVGAADGVETVLADSARHAPDLIRADVQRMVSRLPYEPLDVVLADRSGTLAHPSSDLVFRALGQAANEGGSLHGVLDRLAKRARGLAGMHRRIEIAREQPRATLRTVTGVIIAFTALLFVGARDWMAVYTTSTGQLVLLAVTAWGVWWYRRMNRMARIEPVQRFYAERPQP